MARFLKAMIFSFIFCFQFAEARPQSIIIIRHAEKVNDTDRHLSPVGYQRAEALGRFFSSSVFLNEFGRPAALFAGNPGSAESMRSFETLVPTSKAFDMPIDTNFDKDQGEQLMAYLTVKKSYEGESVIICWNRGGMKDLIKGLRVEVANQAATKWQSGVFDRIWVLKLNEKDQYEFEDRPQKLMPGDSQL